MLCGLLTPDVGHGARSTASTSARDPEGVKRRIGYMSQRFSLYELLTVDQNIRFFGGLYGLTRRRGSRERRRFVLEMAGLAGRERELARDLAGRLAPAAGARLRAPARAADRLPRRADRRRRPGVAPRVLAADRRPLAAGTTVLVTTHYLDEAEHCHRVAIIHAGRLAALGTTARAQAVFADRPIVEVRPPSRWRSMARARRDARRREDEPVRHGRARRAPRRGDATADDLRRRWRRPGPGGHAASTPVVPSLEDVFLDVVDRVSAEARHEARAGRSPQGAAPDPPRPADAADPALRARVLPVPLRLRAQLRHPPRRARGRGPRRLGREPRARRGLRQLDLLRPRRHGVASRRRASTR